jgi:hypothetical protein
LATRREFPAVIRPQFAAIHQTIAKIEEGNLKHMLDKFLKSIGLSKGFDESPQGVFRASQQIGAHAARGQQEALTGPNDAVRTTDGIHWQLQSIGIGGAPGTRWFSPDFKTQGGFLYLAQKVKGQSSSGWLAPFSNLLFKQSLALYGFDLFETPNLASARSHKIISPSLGNHFMAFTSDTTETRQILNPWVQNPLAAWAEKYPLQQFQSAARFSQIVVLFNLNGVYIATPGVLQADQVEEIARLGAALVKSQGM